MMLSQLSRREEKGDASGSTKKCLPLLFSLRFIAPFTKKEKNKTELGTFYFVPNWNEMEH